ncbi:MAG: MATE family efflux transporter, partial [Clostridia bacterium]|nr:MATE family efflux transporter [Clostridia bacterium]
AIGAGIEIFAVLGVLITLICTLLPHQICTLMNAPEEAFFRTVSYIRVCGLGYLFIAAYNLLGSVFKGIGDSKTPLMAVAIATVFNIAGDLLFVAGFQMGTTGAALATIMAQGLSVIICIFIIKRRGLPFEFGKDSFKGTKSIIIRSVKLGSPIAIQSVMVSLSFLVIISLVNTVGLIFSAGLGVAEKVCAFIMLVPSSFAQALAAYVAQNLGAKKPERADKGLMYAISVSFGIAIFIAAFSFIRGDILTGIFSNDPEVILAGWEYLKAYAIDVLLTSFMFCFVGYFNGCGATAFVMTQGVLSAFGIRIPVSYFMSKQVPVSLFKMGLATPCSTAFQIILCVSYFIYRKKKISK